jgi:hypothetical protein
MSLRRSAYVPAALVGLVAAGLGLAGVAAAAPNEMSPASTAPATADSAPVPVPLVNQPVDAGGGLFGMRRGSVPTASTPDLRQVPFADKLPGVGVTPLPRQSDADDTENSEDTGTDESSAAADQ